MTVHQRSGRRPQGRAARRRQSNPRLEAMVAEATVDCCNEDEQVTGLFTMIEDELVVPFETLVLGVSVTVASVELTASGQTVAICSRGVTRQTIPILNLALPTPPPEGAEWIDAHRHWHGAAHGQ